MFGVVLADNHYLLYWRGVRKGHNVIDRDAERVGPQVLGHEFGALRALGAMAGKIEQQLSAARILLIRKA
jgi:hypothetical protein